MVDMNSAYHGQKTTRRSETSISQHIHSFTPWETLGSHLSLKARYQESFEKESEYVKKLDYEELRKTK